MFGTPKLIVSNRIHLEIQGGFIQILELVYTKAKNSHRATFKVKLGQHGP